MYFHFPVNMQILTKIESAKKSKKKERNTLSGEEKPGRKQKMPEAFSFFFSLLYLSASLFSLIPVLFLPFAISRKGILSPETSTWPDSANSLYQNVPLNICQIKQWKQFLTSWAIRSEKQIIIIIL